MSALVLDPASISVWVDGRQCDYSDGTLHVLSHGLNNASCVFEGARAYGGRVYALAEHIARLERSATVFEMALPFPAEAIDAATRELVSTSRLEEAYIRTVAWRGAEQIGISAAATTVHLAIAVIPWTDVITPEQRTEGIRITVSKWRKPSPAAAPLNAKAACHYAVATLGLHAARRAGFDDALFLDHEGCVAEATGANLFAVCDGVLVTPPAVHCLDGITRRTIIGLARGEGIAVREQPMTVRDLLASQEVFLTGTAMEVLPVRQIDDATLPADKHLCERLSDAYRCLVRR